MTHDRSENGFWYSFIAIFVLSLSVLALEISFSHIFSATIQHHMMFGVVGSTLLGLGLGGFLSYVLSRRWPALLDRDAFFIVTGLAFAFAVLTALYLVTHYPWFWYELLPMVITPFVIAGLLMSSIYSRFTHKSHLIYYGDLSGASIGCLLSIILLNGLDGPINTVLTVTGIAISIPLIFAWKSGNKTAITVISILLAGLVILGLTNSRLGVIELDYQKAAGHTVLGRKLDTETIIDTRWDAYSRVDITKFKERPDTSRNIYINGWGQATMIRFDREAKGAERVAAAARLQTLTTLLQYLPLHFEPNDDVLIIGSGGGMEVMMNVVAGTSRITAVEINPLVVQTTLDYSEYNGGVYRYRNVDVVVADGRSFLKRSDKKYDIIFLPLAFTLAQTESSKLMFMEDYLHTIDAFRDYWKRLPDGGRLVIVMSTKWFFSKLLSTGLTLLDEEGLSVEEAFTSIAALHDRKGGGYSHMLMMKKGGYLPWETAELERLAEKHGFDTIHLPYRTPGSADIRALLAGRSDLKTWIEESPANIEPATDDSPFFFMITKGLPRGLQAVLWISAGILLVFTSLFILLHKKAQSRAGRSGLVYFFVYFIALGIGYMLVELSIAHRFILYLGYPTLSLSVVLFSFLLSSGIGSLAGPYLFKRSLSQRSLMAGVLVVVVLVIYYFILPGILESTLFYSIGVKSLFAFLIIAPLGFFMGIPFPTGLQMLKGLHSEAVPWMWGINGVSSFMGAVLSIIIAFKGGYQMNLLVSIIPYSVVAVIAYRSRDKILP